MASDIEIADTISEQIGALALRMIGARDLVATERGLSFRVGRNPGKVTHIRITLDAADTYRFEALNVNARRAEMVKTISSTEGCYFDMLRERIASATGFATSL